MPVTLSKLRRYRANDCAFRQDLFRPFSMITIIPYSPCAICHTECAVDLMNFDLEKEEFFCRVCERSEILMADFYPEEPPLT